VNQPFAVRVQKAKIAGTPKALGQHMLKNQPQEFRPGQGSSPHLFRFTVPVTVVVFI
jgi:hypothetical protein